MAKRTPSPRTAAIRAWHAEREATVERCAEHGHAVNPLAKFGAEYRYVCGCRTGKFRN